MVGSSPPPYDRYRGIVEHLFTDSSGVKVTVQSTTSEDGWDVRVDVEVAPGFTVDDADEQVVRALIMEDRVGTDGYGSFSHVARAFVLEEPLSSGEPGAQSSYSAFFRPQPNWKPNDLTVIAWVQRGRTGEVQNAAGAPLGDPVPVRRLSWGGVKAVFR